MAEQSNALDPIFKLNKVMSSLAAMIEPKGIGEVSKSVTKDDSNRGRNNLTSDEQSRLKESATIIGKVLKVGAFKEGPEAKRLGDLTPNAEKIKAVPTAIRDKVQPAKESSNSLLDSLMNLLGLGSLLWNTAKSWLIKQLSQRLLKPLKGFIEWVGRKIFSGLSWLGGKISTMVGKLVDKIKNSKFYKGFNDIVQSAFRGLRNLWDDVLKGLRGLGTNISNNISKLATRLMNSTAYKRISEAITSAKTGIKNLWDDVLKGLRSLGTRITTAVTGMVSRFQNSTAYKRIAETITSAKAGIKSLWDDVLKGLRGLGTNISNNISKLATRLMNSTAYKRISEAITSAKTGIKNLWDDVYRGLTSLSRGISNVISGLSGRLQNSNAFKGLTNGISSAATSMRNLWDDALKGITGFVDELVGGITRLKDGALEAVKKIPGYDLLKRSLERTQALGTAVKDTTVRVAGNVAKTATRVGTAVRDTTVRVAGNVAKTAVQAGTAVSSAASQAGRAVTEAAEQTGKNQLSKLLTNYLGKGTRFLGKLLKRMPIIGPLIEGIFAAGDIRGYKKEYSEGKITLDDLQQKIGNRIITGVTGMVGASIGAALGTALGPIGTILGGVGGDVLGRWLGGLFVEKIASPDMVKKIGSFFSNDNEKPRSEGGKGWYPDESGEMQDFLIRNGKVYKFNTKDDVLGMKTGGAIDNLMTGLTKDLAKDNSIIRDASIAQVNKLDELIYLMTELLKKPSSASASFISGEKQSAFKVSDIRNKYSNHTLITP